MELLYSPAEMARRLAERVKALRLVRGWSQKEMAARAGLPLPSYRLFERSGQIALVRFVRLLDVLGVAEELEALGQHALQPPARIDELMKPVRQRGRTSKR
jgi:transcriptional regulator with XRE-family HTH domain